MTPNELYNKIWGDWCDYCYMNLGNNKATLKLFSEKHEFKDIILLTHRMYYGNEYECIPDALQAAVKYYPVFNTKLYKAMK